MEKERIPLDLTRNFGYGLFYRLLPRPAYAPSIDAVETQKVFVN